MSVVSARSWLHRLLSFCDTHRNLLGALAIITVLALTGFALHRLLHTMRLADIAASVAATPIGILAASLALTAASYVTLIGYDLSALRYVGQRMPLRTVALASFCGYAIGNTVGFSLLTGGSVRFRIYSAAGLRADDIGRVALFCVIAFGFGICAVSGLGALMRPELLAPVFNVPVILLQGLGLALVASVAGFFLLCARRRELRLGGVILPLPTVPLTAMQLCISAVDLCFASAALYVLMPDSLGLGYFAFLPLYCVAMIAGISSHVPGGLGVFEAVILYALGDHPDKAALVAALVVYRFIYFVVPLIAAGIVLGVGELRRQLPTTRAAFSRVIDLTGAMVPTAASVLSVLAGAILLVSTATPMQAMRAAAIPSLLPLPVVEAAHLLGSIAAVALIMLAPALQRRVLTGYRLVYACLGVGIAAALVKGFDYEAALALSFVGLMLLPYRREFYRHTALLDQPPAPGWMLATLAILGGAVWLTLFAYKHVPYEHALWFTFAFEAEASRSLRSLLAAFLAAGVFTLAQLSRSPHNGVPSPPTADELSRALAIARYQSRADAMLLACGDKQLLFSPSGESVLMFAPSGGSWIALADPIGRDDERGELIWQFRELCDRRRVRAAFYQLRPTHLPLYLDAGLSVIKLGEDARIRLGAFSLQAAERGDLRQALDDAALGGLGFRMLAGDERLATMTRLRPVSDAWLARNGQRERVFAMGSFTAAYLDHVDVACVLKDGAVVAFASLLRTDRTEEAAIDLIRERADAPAVTMLFLILSIILQLQREGVRWFSLGMAALSGPAQRRLAPLRYRLGAVVHEHGEQFYDFRGTRPFKERFDPTWEPRYLAVPDSVDPLVVLADATALIGGAAAGVGRR